MRAAIAIGWGGVKSGGERMAVGQGGAELIPPAVRHRAARRMTILNVVSKASELTERCRDRTL
jgi:hypothetical protein